MSLIDLASLVLAPTATKEGKVYSAIPDTGEGDMTFTRGSSATRVNSAGLIEKERANLLLQSNAFDTTWVTSSSSITGGQSGYDGSSDAWLFDSTSGYIYQSGLGSVSGVHTISVYVKGGTAQGFRIRVDQATDSNYIIDLSDGSLINENDNIAYKSTSVGVGWYRIEMAFVANTITNIQFRVTDLTGATSSGTAYIQDAQLEQGLISTDYIETTTTAVYEGITDDVPRVDYSGGGCPSLLLEPSRTNLIDDYSGYTWDEFNGASIAFNGNQQSPEGLDNAVTWTFSGTSGEVVQRSSITISNSTNYTISGYFKLTSGTLTSGSNQFKGLNGLLGANVSLNTLTSEWQRLSFNVTSSSTDGRVQFRCDDSATIQVYGLQVEAGSYETSIIPTYGTSTTRVQDSCSKTGISELIGQTEGTLFLDFVLDSVDGGNDFRFDITEGTSFDNEIFIGMTNGDLRALIRVSASNVYDSGNISASVGTRYKMAMAYANNDVALYINGTQEDTSSSATIPNTDEITIGNRTDSKAMVVKESLNQAMLFPTRLTNDELQELTK